MRLETSSLLNEGIILRAPRGRLLLLAFKENVKRNFEFNLPNLKFYTLLGCICDWQ